MVEPLKEVDPEEGVDPVDGDTIDCEEVADIMSMAPEDMLARGFVFDPSDHMRTMTTKGGGQYLDVKWRKLWLLSKHPNVVIKSQLMKLVTNGPKAEQIAVFKASVTIPGGGHAEAFGSETMDDFRDFIEKAETKALGRALENLGFGTAMAKEDGESLADSPVEDRYPQREEPRRESRQGDRAPYRREEEPRDEPPREAPRSSRRDEEHPADRALPKVEVAGYVITNLAEAKAAMAKAELPDCGKIFAALVQARWPVDAAGDVRKVWTERGGRK